MVLVPADSLVQFLAGPSEALGHAEVLELADEAVVLAHPQRLHRRQDRVVARPREMAGVSNVNYSVKAIEWEWR